ncbi:MAG TPA: thymidylate kinase [Firmicutes bacterium]|nr:thymidylate kinase [Bacillota bacterium]
MKGKLIVIEGTDCSGKETQTKRLVERLEKEGRDIFTMSFPQYEKPTGRIVGGPVLGKSYICPSYFEDIAHTSPKVIGLYYAADRLYHKDYITEALDAGKTVILDRYTTSNMGHQGGKMDSPEERAELFDFYKELEYKLLGLPEPDAVIFLHMPSEKGLEIRLTRDEPLDEAEKNLEHLKRSEQTYIEMSEKFGFKTISCVDENGEIRTREDIESEVYELAKEIIDGR